MAEIHRDAHGIPHVRGRDLGDLARGQGEVTAFDRAWQLETDLRRAQGRLAELIGAAGAASDVFARRARLDDTARSAFDGLGDEDRRFVTDYAEGVRRGMPDGRARAPEYEQLDALLPSEVASAVWPDHGSLAVLHGAHALFSSFPLVLWRAHVARTLGDSWVDVLAGTASSHSGPEEGSGSNAWAIHGSLTASGLPILAGDPHRTLGLPGVYQQVRLSCDEFDVLGLAFPGVPGVPHFGHAGRTAWGITNAMAHSVEVFRERLRRTPGGVEALGPGGWRRADVRIEVVAVRGADPIEVEAIETERGTVVTDLHETAEGELVGWSVRMPARTAADLGVAAILPLLRARTATDVMHAYGRWVDPVNRVLAADTDGVVLSATAGRVPRSAPADRRLPREGSLSLPAKDVAPPPAIAVTSIAVDANERPARADIDLGWSYSPPHRAERIATLLRGERPARTADLPVVWGDTLSGIAGRMLALLEGIRPDGAAAHARETLLAWDRRMDADSAAAGVFARWQRALIERVAAHPALAALHDPHGFGAVFDPFLGVAANIGPTVLEVLRHPDIRPDADALVVAALADADAGLDWGREHLLHPAHLLQSVPGAEDPGARLAVGMPGASDTVRCTGGSLGLTLRAWRGSVARWAWDLADREQSLWNVPFGADGDPRAPHGADQLRDWLAVTPASVAAREDRTRRGTSRDGDDPASPAL